MMLNLIMQVKDLKDGHLILIKPMVGQKTWQRNANFVVQKESICFTQSTNGRQRTFFQRGFQALRRFGVGQVAQGQRQRVLVRQADQRGQCGN